MTVVRRKDGAAILRRIGPGVITGGADNDLAGTASYSIVGATAGFTQNWLLFLSTPMLIGFSRCRPRFT